ncbi:arabinosyltransferase C [Tsukamurella pulmonis]|uniref:Arabinosyltransferase C n=1 Tax=Tsukamurella pulmonis TaxID=47312 RepID=A0A1H1HS24_9ACTN|nr:arabinosyltransferase domain-containing protein [Tsukamurella pulmonis]SDR28213.1 arabinosyltransferase C [Tsukamurella pulmonis]SUP13431.1 Probable arabinosyltransferase C [Tsukamurella pulmonis]
MLTKHLRPGPLGDRLRAGVLGLVGFLCAVVVPFLPVHQDAATVTWPGEDAVNIELPLVSYSPTSLSLTVGDQALLSTEGTVLTTVPSSAPDSGRDGLIVMSEQRDGARHVTVRLRSKIVYDGALQGPIQIRSDAASTLVRTGEFQTTLSGDHRPQVVGLFSTTPREALGGSSATIDIDSRFSTGPTAAKVALSVLAVLAWLGALWFLHRADLGDGRRARRILPARWARITRPDLVVVGLLLAWYMIGVGSSDDGYFSGMAKTYRGAGYLANYFAYFGVPEVPIGIPYVPALAGLAQISDSGLVLRLPSLLCGLGCWFLISREVLPRVGVRGRRRSIALYTGGLVLLAFWIPYNNGLRPEPVVAFFTLLSWLSVERAIATRRMLPLCVAVGAGSLAVLTNPAGIICFAGLLSGLGPIVAGFRARSLSLMERAAVLMPVLASGVITLVVVFHGQSAASVSAMRAAHGVVGPNMPWYTEYTVWAELFQPQPDGSVARRFAVLIFLLALVAVVAALWRRRRIPGLASGPVGRLAFTAVLSLFLMSFSPTKFTHHFGSLAGYASAVAVVAAAVSAPAVVRSLRDRLILLGAVTAVLAICFTATNGWWYVSSYHVPWWDKRISVGGVSVGSMVLVLALALFVAAGCVHLSARHDDSRVQRLAGGLSSRAFALSAALIVTVSFTTMTKAAVAQYPAFSVGLSNARALGGDPCGLADFVDVDPDPGASFLEPVEGSPESALGSGTHDGFRSTGVASDLGSDKSSTNSATVGQSLGSTGTTTSDDDSGDGAARRSSGARVALPFGFDAARVPVLGSFGSRGQRKSLVSGWYRIPRDADGTPRDKLLTMAVAGRIASVDVNGDPVAGQRLVFEFGREATREPVASGPVAPEDLAGMQPAWRDVRLDTRNIPAGADVVRIRADVDSADPQQWIAVTPPRMPRLQSLQDYVGRQSPVLLDWLVGAQFPCLAPMPHQYGVATIPEFRVLPDKGAAKMTTNWQSHSSGGPLGYTDLLTTPVEVPTYLRDDPRRDWGSLQRLRKRLPAEPASLEIRRETRSGLWSPGPLNYGIR